MKIIDHKDINLSSKVQEILYQKGYSHIFDWLEYYQLKKPLKTPFFKLLPLQNYLSLIVVKPQISKNMFFKKLKICYLWQGKKQVPKINISGSWLQSAGFEIGENVKISISNNQIIITNDHKNA